MEQLPALPAFWQGARVVGLAKCSGRGWPRRAARPERISPLRGRGLPGRIASPLKAVVGRVLLGSSAWVERMGRALGASEAAPNAAELGRVAWRPSQEQIERAVAEEFGVDVCELFANRVKHNDARAAALYLVRRLTSVSAPRLAERYGNVSQAAISKAVQRAALRRARDRRWRGRLARLEQSLRREGPTSMNAAAAMR